MARTIGERLASNAPARVVGRAGELRALLRVLEPDGPLVVHVHGVSGIGKSTLLTAFAADARGRGATVLLLDGRSVEPTEEGFLSSLSAALDGAAPTLPAVVEGIALLPSPTVLVVDSYELLGLLDAWLRQTFLPALPDDVRVVLAGRHAPTPQWSGAPEWRGLFREIAVGPLGDGAARSLLASLGLTGGEAEAIARIGFGHPLALTLAGTVASRGPPAAGDQLPAVLHELSRRFLDEIEDEPLRRALRAACVLRRVTRSLLHALAPDASPDDALERLGALPFVEAGRDGLVVHDAVREAIAADLRATDPVGHLELRRAAWRCLTRELRSAPRTELWRYTADLIHLVENPVVREAFFPRDAARLSVEPARPEHAAAVRDVAERHETPEGAAVLAGWWRRMPESFWVVRAPGGAVAGFYCLFDPSGADGAALDADPLAARWRDHLGREPMPAGQSALFLRRWLSREDGEAPSPVQAAAWLDIKRHYMERRPRLRRVYLALADPAPYAEAAARLGFLPLDGGTVRIGGAAFTSVVLDMGPASVDGWLAWLLAAELGIPEQGLIDRDSRALRVAGATVPLTRREYEVIDYLSAREGVAVSRDELLSDVWGLRFDGGSNVVDTVVAGLRRKLGEMAPAIETVRGHGYRYRHPGGEP